MLTDLLSTARTQLFCEIKRREEHVLREKKSEKEQGEMKCRQKFTHTQINLYQSIIMSNVQYPMPHTVTPNDHQCYRTIIVVIIALIPDGSLFGVRTYTLTHIHY